MRLATWNIEWMNKWFEGQNPSRFIQNLPKNGITDIDDLCTRVANVIDDINSDVLTIQEGPSSKEEMNLFVDNYLSDTNGPKYHVFGGIDGSRQRIFTLVKKTGQLQNPILSQTDFDKLKEEWDADVDGRYELSKYHFPRTPLVVSGVLGNTGKTIKIISLHAKSKYIHMGSTLWKNSETKECYIRLALKNRRRITTEARRTRIVMEEMLQNDQDGLIAVTGDFNDGPGFEYFERNFTAYNVTDVLLGSTFYPEMIFKNPITEMVDKQNRFTAKFDDFIEEIDDKPLLLDHILVSPKLYPRVTGAAISHVEYENQIDNGATGRQREPSDHRPVYVDINAN